MLNFIRTVVDPDGSRLVTDEYGAYRIVRRVMDHSVINHQKQWVNGEVHTNTIEGVWSLLPTWR